VTTQGLRGLLQPDPPIAIPTNRRVDQQTIRARIRHREACGLAGAGRRAESRRSEQDHPSTNLRQPCRTEGDGRVNLVQVNLRRPPASRRRAPGSPGPSRRLQAPETLEGFQCGPRWKRCRQDDHRFQGAGLRFFQKNPRSGPGGGRDARHYEWPQALTGAWIWLPTRTIDFIPQNCLDAEAVVALRPGGSTSLLASLYGRHRSSCLRSIGSGAPETPGRQDFRFGSSKGRSRRPTTTPVRARKLPGSRATQRR